MEALSPHLWGENCSGRNVTLMRTCSPRCRAGWRNMSCIVRDKRTECDAFHFAGQYFGARPRGVFAVPRKDLLCVAGIEFCELRLGLR